MNPTLKQRWIGALRSGEYEQGTEYLRNPSLANPAAYTYCCLGVLAHIMHGDAAFTSAPDNVHPCQTQAGDELLNNTYLKEAGLQDDTQVKLTELNDAGHSFSYLSNIIEMDL